MYTKEQYNKTYRGEAIYRILKDGAEIATDIRGCNLRPLAFYDKDNHPTVAIHLQEKPMSLHLIKDAMTLWEDLISKGENPSEYMIGFSNCALTGHFYQKKGGDTPLRANSAVMDKVSLDWHDLAKLSKDFCQLPQGESVQIVDDFGRRFSYAAVIDAVKKFAQLAGMKVVSVEPWYGGSYGFKFRTNLKKWVIKINHNGSLNLCHD